MQEYRISSNQLNMRIVVFAKSNYALLNCTMKMDDEINAGKKSMASNLELSCLMISYKSTYYAASRKMKFSLYLKSSYCCRCVFGKSYEIFNREAPRESTTTHKQVQPFYGWKTPVLPFVCSGLVLCAAKTCKNMFIRFTCRAQPCNCFLP